MLAYGTKSQGDAHRRQVPAGAAPVYKGEWMSTGEHPQLSPTISLIEQAPGSTLVPHFHRQNQFQVFVGGHGKLGAAALDHVTIHYAGAYTGYGPLVAGEDGIQYFTIRPVCESGMIPVDGGREQMVRGPKRHATSEPLTPSTPQALAQLPAEVKEWAIPMAPDGLGAARLLVPPGASVSDIAQAAADGTFVMVLAGSLCHGTQELDRWESLFYTPDDYPEQLAAGKAGADIVVLYTPAKAPAYR